jgi:hypothetical protein
MAGYWSCVLWSLIIFGVGARRAYGVTSGLNLGSNALKFVALSSMEPTSLAKGAILSGSGDFGGQSISLATGASAGADVVANAKGVTLGTDATVAGAYVTAGAKIKLRNGANCVSQDTTGFNADLTTLSAAITELTNFETALAATAPTQTLVAISLPVNGSMTITNTVVGGQNIVSIPSVTPKKGATLQLSGGERHSYSRNKRQAQATLRSTNYADGWSHS